MVEHNLAKVGAVGSNPISRSGIPLEVSKFFDYLCCLFFDILEIKMPL